MGMTKRACRAVLPLAALLMGTAMPGVAAATEQNAHQPDWLLLAVAGIALVIGRLVIPRLKRDRKTPL